MRRRKNNISILCCALVSLVLAKAAFAADNLTALNASLNSSASVLKGLLGPYHDAVITAMQLACTSAAGSAPDQKTVQDAFISKMYQITDYKLSIVNDPILEVLGPSHEAFQIIFSPADGTVMVEKAGTQSNSDALAYDPNLIVEVSSSQKCELGSILVHKFYPDGRPLMDLSWDGNGIQEADINTPPKSLQQIYGNPCQAEPDLAFSKILAAASDTNRIAVAVIDVGIDYDDPTIAYKFDRKEPGLDMVQNDYTPSDLAGGPFLDADQGHGTAVSAIAVAGSDKLELVAIRHDATKGLLSNIAAFDYAEKRGARVVNMSFGDASSPGASEVKQLCDSIQQHSNMLFVAAADDNGQNDDVNPVYPASCKATNLISVGATTSWGFKADFSGYGKNTVDIGALGVGIPVDLGHGSTAIQEGTSLAAPEVANVAGMILVINPKLSPEQVIAILENSSSKRFWLKNDFVSGGILNETAALRMAKDSLAK